MNTISARPKWTITITRNGSDLWSPNIGLWRDDNLRSHNITVGHYDSSTRHQKPHPGFGNASRQHQHSCRRTHSYWTEAKSGSIPYFARIDDTMERVRSRIRGICMVPAEITGSVQLVPSDSMIGRAGSMPMGRGRTPSQRPFRAPHVGLDHKDVGTSLDNPRRHESALVTAEASRRNTLPVQLWLSLLPGVTLRAGRDTRRCGAAPDHGPEWLDMARHQRCAGSDGLDRVVAVLGCVADRPLGIQVVVEFLHSFIDDLQ